MGCKFIARVLQIHMHTKHCYFHLYLPAPKNMHWELRVLCPIGSHEKVNLINSQSIGKCKLGYATLVDLRWAISSVLTQRCSMCEISTIEQRVFICNRHSTCHGNSVAKNFVKVRPFYIQCIASGIQNTTQMTVSLDTNICNRMNGLSFW